jgi:hypothetical protein
MPFPPVSLGSASRRRASATEGGRSPTERLVIDSDGYDGNRRCEWLGNGRSRAGAGRSLACHPFRATVASESNGAKHETHSISWREPASINQCMVLAHRAALVEALPARVYGSQTRFSLILISHRAPGA